MGSFLSSTVEDGLSTLFWKDDWFSGVIAENFPRAYSFASNEDVFVQTFLTIYRLSSNFWLPLSPQAFEEVKDLQSLAVAVTISSESDSWSYPWGKEYTSSRCSVLPLKKGMTPVLSATPWITDSTTVQNIVIIAIVSKLQRKSCYMGLQPYEYTT
jgi:hypothetical protein